MIDYSIKNDTILIVNKTEIDFQHNINKVVEVGDVLIVHVQDTIGKKPILKASEQPLNAVYAVDANGDIQWNIKEIIPKDELYTGIHVNDSGNLVVNTYTGIAQIIDVKSEKVIGHFVTK